MDSPVYVCPCHNSAFAAADGRRLGGPAPRGLYRFRVTDVTETSVVIGEWKRTSCFLLISRPKAWRLAEPASPHPGSGLFECAGEHGAGPAIAAACDAGPAPEFRGRR